MIQLILLCQLTLADLNEVQIQKLISRLQSKAEREGKTLHTQRGTTYASPSSVQAPHVPFTHKVMGFGVRGPSSRITIKSPAMTQPKGCKCFPHCKCGGDCGKNCTCIFDCPVHKVITSDLKGL